MHLNLGGTAQAVFGELPWTIPKGCSEVLAI